MAKDTFYFSHDYNSRADEKIKLLIRSHGILGYGTFWAIIEDLYNNANALRTDYEGIAFDLRIDTNIVKSVINDFDLFIIKDDFFGSLSVQRRLDDRNAKSKKASNSANYRWSKQKDDANAMRTQCERNAIKERKGKEIKEKKNNISKDIWEQALVVTNEIIKEEHGDPEINNILETIKEQVEFLWFIYKKWSHERERAQNILTGKEFWDICEKSNLSRVEFCKSIIFISSKLDFWNGKIYNAETLYKNYAMVYNTAMSKKYWPKSESALDIVL